MAGGEGPSRRRTAKSVEAAAAGPPAPLRRCSSSTKRKAAKGAAPGPMPLPRAKSQEEETAAAEVEKPTGVMHRLTAKEIRDILAEKVEPPSLRTQALKRNNPELVPRPGEEKDERLMRHYILARAFYDIQERLPKFQDWVRAELKNKGYVEVDEEVYKRKADVQAMIDRYWPETVALIRRLGVIVEGGGDESESESDSDDEEGDE